MRLGFSYLRYSSPQQGDGDSIRRQTKATADWCRRHDVQLDAGRTYLDRGRSAYHGRHRQRGGALASFLAEVERGDIPRGSVLIIENLDRLSRENPWDAVPLLCSIVNAGITVATLFPTEMTFERGSDMTALVLAVVEFGRGHSESASKANRMGEVWSEKRRAVRENGAILTRMLPAWIQERGGKLVLIPDRARVVRRMFELALAGYGLGLIVREFERDGIPTWGGGSKGWTKNYVHKILTGRSVLGEYQPTAKGKPDGDPIPDYYPAVVDESTWLQVGASLQRRKHRPGPVKGKAPTLFAGLLRDAAGGDKLQVAQQGRTLRRILRPARSMEGGSSSVSFPYDVFESAVLSLLREVDPADVVGRESQSESASVAAELAAKEQRARQIEAELGDDESDAPTLARVLKKLDGECVELRKRLADLRQREANPRSVAWAETRSLLDVAQGESARLRLRELLRTIVTEAWVLIVPRASHRFAAVQVYFTGDGRRDYLVHYQAAANRRPGSWCACSLPSDIGPGDLDLRRAADANELRRVLESVDVGALVGAMTKIG